MTRLKHSRKIKITCGLWDSFKDWKDKFKFIYPQVDRKKYVEVCHEINKIISDKIIRESFEFRMPARLGTLAIRKNKVKIKVKDGKLEKNKMIIDWGKTWEYWNEMYPGKSRKEVNAMEDKVVIYNMNEHTNGYVMRWKWDKTTAMVPNQTVYKFRPTKRNRLELGAWIMSDERSNDYYLSTRYGNKKIKRITEERAPVVEQEGDKEQSN